MKLDPRLRKPTKYLAILLGAAALGFLAFSLLLDRAREVAVPSVAGLGLAEALDRLSVQQLDLEVRDFEFSEVVPENRIIRQRPAAGRVVKAGRGVRVVLSRGPERHAVPRVAGLSLEDARIQLEEAGLTPSVALRLRAGQPDVVVAQGVAVGTWLRKGAPVPLVVSLGTPPLVFRMPAVVELPLDRALAELDAAGLGPIQLEELLLEDPGRDGAIVHQTPASGHPVARGEPITLTVIEAAPRGAIASSGWVVRSLPPGLGRHRVELVVEGRAGTWVLADEWVGGGETFRRYVPLRAGESARLRVDGEER